MNELIIDQDPKVIQKFESYPEEVRPKLDHLRQLIYEVADDCPDISTLEETLKWGEPSYLTKIGSTLRMDWKAKKPEQYAMYFKCTSRLIPTIKEVYDDLFRYENNRAILFGLEEEIPHEALKVCVEMALRYHKVKHLPRLGY